MKNMWVVMLPWAESGKPDDDESTYRTYVEADDMVTALRAVATQMANDPRKVFDSEEDREEYISSRIQGWADVASLDLSVADDMAELFADELFPDGAPRRKVDMVKLAKLLSDSRDAILS